jgi:hypothetical protein
MGWGARSWLKLSLEQDNAGAATYGVYPTKTSPVLNTDFIWLDLDQDDAFGVDTDPQYTMIRAASSLNEVVSAQTSRYLVQGALSTLFRPEHSPFLLKWALARLANKQAWSVSADYFDSQVTRRYVGGKVGQAAFTGAAAGQEYRLGFATQFQTWPSRPRRSSRRSRRTTTWTPTTPCCSTARRSGRPPSAIATST